MGNLLATSPLLMKDDLSQACWYTLVIPALRSLRQEDCKFEAKKKRFESYSGAWSNKQAQKAGLSLDKC
jgi:hypothetical protein